jgi:hypothetical protein
MILLLKKIRHNRTNGQAMIIVALMMLVLVLFVGLGIDAGNLMGKKAKLQSAVDASALSAALTIVGGTIVTPTTNAKAYQILESNGVPSSTLVGRLIDFPAPNQVHVRAVQRVPTLIMGIVPAFRTVDISAEATADVNSYAEINIKPFGSPGIVTELNLMTWGADSWRRGGDAYSPVFGIGSGLTANPEHPKQPYGYLYRIDVPPSYTSTHLLVEFFDPDSYNQPGQPPAWPVATPGTATPTPSANQYASCGNPRPGTCTSSGADQDTGMKLNAFPSGRPAFWRVDEIRIPYNRPFGGEYNSADATTTQYTLWHFGTHITSAFGDPALLSDQPSGGYLARYTVGWNAATDLAWYRPNGFDIQLQGGLGNDLFQREQNGGFYFYLFVQGISGSSENNFDIRVGPPESNGGGCSTPCNVNQQYLTGNPADWQDGGARVFAKRALPLNLDTGASFPLMFTQVSKNAAGQVLGVRHFDQDCNAGCGSQMQYQMQVCGCANLADPTCWTNIGVGYVGDNDAWLAPPDASHPGGYPDPEPVNIPLEGTALYTTLFGSSGQCPTSWMRIASNPSYSGDTTVWEMPYIRPRLIK